MKKYIPTLILTFIFITPLIQANESYYKNGKLVELIDSYSERSIYRSSYINTKNKPIKYYKTTNGKSIGVSNKILVQCKKDTNCPKLLEYFNLSNFTKLSNDIYKVTVENNNVFDMSKMIFETGKVEFAHPDFTKKRIKR